jgi:hypothetical protein
MSAGSGSGNKPLINSVWNKGQQASPAICGAFLWVALRVVARFVFTSIRPLLSVVAIMFVVGVRDLLTR